MDESEVILDVSNTLVTAINGALQDLFPGVAQIASLNDLSEPNATAPLTPMTVFLYEIMEDPGSRNLPPIRQSSNNSATSKLPPMALQLNYLITPWTNNFETDQRLLGRVLRLFYENAILSGPQLTGVLSGTTATLKVSLHPIVLEDRTRIWHALTRPYRTSLSYGVRVVKLQSSQTQTLTPVINGRIDSGVKAGATS